MNPLRPGLPPLPHHMAHLPIDKRGFPVPYFVAVINGEPDHRIAVPEVKQRCLRQGLCWICGKPLGTFRSFVAGPMCAINRVSAEPASHLDCARYAVRACPFLSRPHAHRREDKPEGTVPAPGVHLQRNPGVVLIWTTRRYQPFRVQHGWLVSLGEPDSVEWYAEGRPATLAEVKASIVSGLPALIEAARVDGAAALQALDQMTTTFMAQVERQFAEAVQP
jgi:hypothetical protein